MDVVPSSEDYGSVLSLQEAATELGWTLEELVAQMVNDGLLLEHPSGYGYVASPHPDIVPLQ